MRINPTNSSPVQANESSGAKKSDRIKSQAYEGKTEGATTAKKTDSASTEISAKAKDMAKAQQLAADTPDIREAKVAALREQIQNKKYNVSANDIADRLVDDHMKFAGA